MSSARWRIILKLSRRSLRGPTNISNNKFNGGERAEEQDRILVNHAGSLPRGEPLGSMLIDQEAGKPVETDVLNKAIEARVTTS